MNPETLKLEPFTEKHKLYQTVQVIAAVMGREAAAEHVSENTGGKLAEKFYDENFAGKLPPYDLLVAAGVLMTCALENLERITKLGQGN